MKKLIEQIGTETVFAGLFGLTAIVAVFFEMAIAGFDAASIAGGVKDIAGTIITVVMLIFLMIIVFNLIKYGLKNGALASMAELVFSISAAFLIVCIIAAGSQKGKYKRKNSGYKSSYTIEFI